MDRCTACRQPLYDYETDRLACLACQDRARQQLAAIAGPDGLYASLHHHLTPAGRPRSGTIGRQAASSKAPCSEDTLDLMIQTGPVVGTLELWARDWQSYGRGAQSKGGTLQQRVDQATATLRFNLGWACAEHPAVDEFLRELETIHRRLYRMATGERAPRGIPVHCATTDCAGVLRATVSGHGGTCDDCGAEYGHTELLHLQPARRTAA
jgi:hypothetical protein